MNRDTREYDEPVDLPDGVDHGGSRAYTLGCRCRYCVKFRRLYDQMARYRTSARNHTRKTGARHYLAHRGVQVWGPGPWFKNPLPLARLVAEYLGDDIELWTESE